jgi:hypothetical protein
MSQTDLRSNGSGQSLRRHETRSGWEPEKRAESEPKNPISRRKISLPQRANNDVFSEWF